MGLQVLTTMWGEKHVEQFERVCLKGMLWPLNKQALTGLEATWNIYTDEKFHDRVKSQIPQGITAKMGSMRDLMDYIDPFQSAFIKTMRECLKNEDKLLIIPSDLMFGDGSIHNLWMMGKDKHSVVVVPHMRVLPEFLDNLSYSLSNSEMVTRAFNHLHDSWVFAEKGHHNQSSFHGGVEWEELDDGIYSVTHRLPAPFLMDFTEEDLNYFLMQPILNSLDHSWPGDILVPRGRQVFVGSSDAVFLVEPTEAGANVPNILPGQPPDGRGFHRSQIHNLANAQFRAIFRGE